MYWSYTIYLYGRFVAEADLHYELIEKIIYKKMLVLMNMRFNISGDRKRGTAVYEQ